MAISYPLSIPSDVAPRTMRWYGRNSVGLSMNPFTLTTQVQAFQGQLWGVDIAFPPMDRATAEKYVAFLLSLRGQYGSFYVQDNLGILPKGVATGSPKVNGANQTGEQLITDGWDVSQTGILKAGDKIQVGNRLYGILQDANSDDSGNATFDIWPRLREQPANDETIITVRPKGLFRLADSTPALWGADETQLYDISFSAVEVI